jgi:hypothetical protein
VGKVIAGIGSIGVAHVRAIARFRVHLECPIMPRLSSLVSEKITHLFDPAMRTARDSLCFADGSTIQLTLVI